MRLLLGACAMGSGVSGLTIAIGGLSNRRGSNRLPYPVRSHFPPHLPSKARTGWVVAAVPSLPVTDGFTFTTRVPLAARKSSSLRLRRSETLAIVIHVRNFNYLLPLLPALSPPQRF